MAAAGGIDSFPGDGGAIRGRNESGRVMTQSRQEQWWPGSDPESSLGWRSSGVAADAGEKSNAVSVACE